MLLSANRRCCITASLDLWPGSNAAQVTGLIFDVIFCVPLQPLFSLILNGNREPDEKQILSVAERMPTVAGVSMRTDSCCLGISALGKV